ncbi:MAG: hypothetical protein IT385_16325 [Deltaproteobacteria bacterium]|nr:hypothetical protein [Deltaproteobacteria bacterium]
MLGALIGFVIGMIIVGIIQATRSSKAKQHAAGVRAVVAQGGQAGRAALDRRLPARASLFQDADAEAQAERLAALAALGDADAIAAEMAAYKGSTIHVTTVRLVGRLGLALAGREPDAQLAAAEAELAALEAAGTNRLTLRALGAWVPVLRALAHQNTLGPAERAEVLRFQSRDVVRKLLQDAFARIDASAASAA